MLHVASESTNGEARLATRIHYAVEYTDAIGRRRRARRTTLGSAERFSRGLRLGSDPVIRIVWRQVKR
jgi:hypothetical protein